jgi:hypothetical protein
MNDMTPDQVIKDLAAKMNMLAQAINAFSAAVSNISSANEVLSGLITELIGQNQYATAISNALSKIISPPDLAGQRSAALLMRTYLKSTEFMDHLPSIDKLEIKDAKTKPAYDSLVQARRAVHTALTALASDTTSDLALLLNESAALAAQSSVTVSQIVTHLRSAQALLRQLRQSNTDMDNDLLGKLVENWEAAIEALSEPSAAPGEADRRAAVAQTLELHSLLESIYDLLAQDVSAENPLDLVSL